MSTQAFVIIGDEAIFAVMRGGAVAEFRAQLGGQLLPVPSSHGIDWVNFCGGHDRALQGQ